MPPAAGKGRPRGSRNKIPQELKAMILAALDDAGGKKYLAQQAIENPTAFLSLVGKILPHTINGTMNVSVERLDDSALEAELASILGSGKSAGSTEREGAQTLQ